MVDYVRPCLLTVILLCCLQAGRLQGQGLNFIHYNTDNSALPHDICYRLMQDKEGYLWIGTDNGLVRFDGLDMKILRKEFGSPFITATSQYKDIMLVSTWKGGVYRLKGDAALQIQSPEPQNIVNSNKILLYKNIVVLNSFSATTYYRYNVHTNTLNALEPLLRPKDSSIKPKISLIRQQIKADDFKCFLLGDHLFAYNAFGIFRLRDTVFEQVSDDSFDQICRSGNNSYGIRGNSVYQLSPGFLVASKVYTFSTNVLPAERNIRGFAVLPSGNIVLFSDAIDKCSRRKQTKCLLVNRATGRVTNLIDALKLKVFVSDILVDRENGFWLSTYGQGLYHVFEPEYRQYADFENAFVTDMLLDSSKQLYIGTQKGLYLFSRQAGKQAIRLVYPDEYVGRLFKNRNNEVCAQSKTTVRGIVVTSKGRIRKGDDQYSRSTFHYYTSESRDSGIKLYDKQTNKLIRCAWDSIRSPLTDFCEDGRGRIWLASNPGLYYWDKEDKPPTLCYHATLRKAFINKLLPDSANGVWVGSSAGLFYLRQNKVIATYKETNGLSNIHINAMLLNGNKLWIGTQNGLNILNLGSGNISVYKKYNGLIANDVTALSLYSDTEVAVGSSKGITIINSEQTDRYPQPTQVLLEQVLINGHTTSLPIAIDYNSRIAVTYNAVSFVYPELTRFQYKLSAKDEWIETKNKSIVLTSLEPGTYDMQIRAKKYNGRWSDPVALNFRIKKPWWKTTLFYIIAAGGVVSCTYFLVREKGRKAYRKAIVQQQFSELKLKALQARLNPHFISNTLSTIQFFNLTHDQEATNEYLTRFANLTRLFLESAHNRFILLKDELQIVTYYLGLEKIRFKDRFIYEIQVAPGINTEQELIPGVLLQPFVENSINHGIAYLPKEVQGYILVTIEKQAGQLEIVIRDNGIGRKKAAAIQQVTGKMYRSRSSEIMENVKQVINSLAGCHISITVTDLSDSKGIPSGTQVDIHCYIATKHHQTYENINY